MSLTIDRTKWVRGGSPYHVVDGNSELRNDKNRMCCLGFLGEYCGINTDNMAGLELPSDVGDTIKEEWPNALFEYAHVFTPRPYATWEDVFADINDAHVDDATREEWLTTGFKILMDIDLSFEGGDPHPEGKLIEDEE